MARKSIADCLVESGLEDAEINFLSGEIKKRIKSIDVVKDFDLSTPVTDSIVRIISPFVRNTIWALEAKQADIYDQVIKAVRPTGIIKKVGGKWTSTDKRVQVGKEGRAFTADNKPIDFVWAVAPREMVTASHLPGMKTNPKFPPEMQPRDRDRKALIQQVGEISNKLNPDRLLDAPGFTSGAPATDKTLTVVAGNGRKVAIDSASAEKIEEYEDRIIQKADKFGLSSFAGPQDPLLIRIITTDIDPVEFARQTNKGEGAEMSPLEKAIEDARLMTPDDLKIFAPDQRGNVAAASNRAFIERFVKRLGTNEAAGLLTADKLPTKQLIDRIQAAIFQKAYDNSGLTTLMAEDADPNIKNILNALIVASSHFIDAKAIDEDLGGVPIIDHIVGAVTLMVEIRNTGVTAEEFLAQGRLFEPIPDLTKDIVRTLDQYKRSPKTMGAIFSNIADILKDGLVQSQTGELPGMEGGGYTVNSEDLVDKAIQKWEERNGTAAQGSLFEEPDKESHDEGEQEPSGRGERQPGGEIGTAKAPSVIGLAKVFEAQFKKDASKLKNKAAVRKFVAALYKVKPAEITSFKPIEEAIEYAIVLRARYLIKTLKTDERIYPALKALYAQQPNLSTRTSTSVKNQAYSTPVHLGWLMQRFAGVVKGEHPNDGSVVYEPTAGTGMLLTAASPGRTWANEIDKVRAAILKDQAAVVSEWDAKSAVKVQSHYPNPGGFDAVLANPPFGAIKARDMDGFRITKIEHAIVIDALKALKKGGKAAIIIGGKNFNKGKMAESQRVFLNYLYNRFKVTYNIDIPGEEYSKQGAKFPIRMIVIDGQREPGSNVFAPPHGSPEYTEVESVDEIFNLLQEKEYEAGVGSTRDDGQSLGPDGLGGGRGERPADDTGGLHNLPGGQTNTTPGMGGGGPSTGTGRPSASGMGTGGGNTEGAGSSAPGDGGRGVGGKPDVRGDISPKENDVEGAGDLRGGGKRPAGDTGAGTSGTGRLDTPGASGTDTFLSGLLDINAEEEARGKAAAEKRAREKKEAKAKKETNDKLQEGLSDIANSTSTINDLLGEKGQVGGDFNPELWPKIHEALKKMWEGFGKVIQALKERAEQFIKHAHKELSYKVKPYLDKFIQEDIRAAFDEEAAGSKKDKKTEAVSEYQSVYVPKSKGPIIDETLVPSYLAPMTAAALDDLEKEVGDIDVYVTQKVGFESVEEMWKGLSADQVDAVGLSIRNIENGTGMIVGDQTGVGKGRIAAAVFEYAKRQGTKPVFFTEKANLFSDFYRDILDIGKFFNPFIFGSNKKLATITDEDGRVAYVPPENTRERPRLLRAIAREGQDALGNHDSAVTTYSQINTTGNLPQQAITTLAAHNFFILDESHNASGKKSNTGIFLRQTLAGTMPPLYLSATFAKRPETMPIYFRTAMSQANITMAQLITAVEAGGTALQEIMSSALARQGQYIRREKSFKGIDINVRFDTENRVRDERISDEATGVLRDVVAFDQQIAAFITDVQQDVAGGSTNILGGIEIPGAVLDPGTSNRVTAGLDRTNFASVVHNAVRQLLLSMKAPVAAEQAIKDIKDGKKPVIGLSYTMGSFFKEEKLRGHLEEGDKFELTFANVLERHLRRTLQFKIRRPTGGKPIIAEIPIEALPPNLRRRYDAILNTINNSVAKTLPGSPIDYIKQEAAKAGYIIGEITARDYVADLTDPHNPIVRRRPGSEKAARKEMVKEFNDDVVHGIIVNAAGASGVSMHSSPAFGSQKPRKYIGIQPELNIDTEVQKMGRINRKGQLITAMPSYLNLFLDIPAEIRPAAVLMGKMESLSANTSANADSPLTRKTHPNLFNRYGDRVVAEWIRANSAIGTLLGVSADAGAKKITGRMAIHPVEMQRQFYEAVEDEYNALIEEEKQAGTYTLEVQDIDFKAELLKKEVLTSGIDESSEFGKSTYREELSVVNPRKPLKKKEIIKEVNDKLKGKTAHQHIEGYLDEIRTETEAYLSAKKETMKQEPFDNLVDRTATTILNMTRLIDQVGLKIGADYGIRNIAGLDGMGGVLVDIKLAPGNGNPAAFSRTRLVFAVDNALRKYTIPLSRVAPDMTSNGIQIGDSNGSRLKHWDTALPRDVRTTRYAMTGNLLQGYADAPSQSRIVRFTMQNGAQRTGILMPLNYRAGQTNTVVRVTPEEAVGLISMPVANTPYNIPTPLIGEFARITSIVQKGGHYRLSVPRSRQQGGSYFLDTELLSLVEGDFESSGQSMRADFPKDKIRQVVSRIYALGDTLTVSRSVYDAFKGDMPASPNQVQQQIEKWTQQSIFDIPEPKEKKKKAKVIKLKNKLALEANVTVKMADVGDFPTGVMKVRNTFDAAQFAQEITDDPQENALVVSTDADGNVLQVHQYSRGGGTASVVDSIHAFSAVFRIPDVKKTYFIHNHPGGKVDPSPSDILIARKANEILRDVGGIDTHSIIISHVKDDKKSNQFFDMTNIPAGITEWSNMAAISTASNNAYRARTTNIDKIARGEPQISWPSLQRRIDTRRVGRVVSPTNISTFAKGREGFVLMDASNSFIGFLPWQKGISKRAATKQIYMAAEQTGTTGMVIRLDTIGSDRQIYLSALIPALRSYGLVVHDVAVSGQSVIDGIAPHSPNKEAPLQRDPGLYEPLSSDKKLYQVQGWDGGPGVFDRLRASRTALESLRNLDEAELLKHPRLKSGTFTRTPEGHLRVTFKGGNGFAIKQVKEIQTDKAILEADYKQKQLGPGQKIGAVYDFENQEITFSRYANRYSVDHELMHFLEESGFLQQFEIAAINRAITKAGGTPGREARAFWLQDAFLDRDGQEKIIQRILQAIADFIDTIVNALGKTTARGVLRGVESGKIQSRDLDTINEFAQPISYSLTQSIKEIFNNPNFKKWFKGSKVVDENGDPLVVYHGTNKSVDSFSVSEMGESGRGIYLTDTPTKALSWAQNAANWKKGGGQNIMPLFVRMAKPFDSNFNVTDRPTLLNQLQKIGVKIELNEYGSLVLKESKDTTEALEKLGYDGIIRRDGSGDILEIVPFHPTQIKSIYNQGTFDPKNPDIWYETTAARWYSQMEKHLEKNLPAKGTPKSYRQIINSWAGKGLFKSEELDWSGLNEWLSERQGKIAKQDVLDYLAENNVRVEETVKGRNESGFVFEGGWTNDNFGNDIERYEVSDMPGVDNVAWEIVETNGEFAIEQIVEGQEGFTYSDWMEAFDNVEEARQYIEDRAADWVNERAPQATDTKFPQSQYRTPGGENYRELLLTLPRKFDAKTQTRISELNKKTNEYTATKDEQIELNRLLEKRTAEEYTGPHYDEPNVLAHVRFDEKTDVDGNRVLFIDEVQSDWHQEARRLRVDEIDRLVKGGMSKKDAIKKVPVGFGYKGEKGKALERISTGVAKTRTLNKESVSLVITDNNGETIAKTIKPDIIEIERLASRPKDYYGQDWFFTSGEHEINYSGIPNAPFKQSKQWSLLAIKRMVRWAAENGFDKVAWTPGEIQADRYDLSKHIKEINYEQDTDGSDNYDLQAIGHNGIEAIAEENITLSRIEELAGKEIAEKIKNGEGKDDFGPYRNWKSLTGLDLKVGGKGMKGFYDKILPAAVNKFFHKAAWGKARVGVTEVVTHPFVKGEPVIDMPGSVYEDMPQKTQEVWSLSITPEMRQKTMREGLPQYQIMDSVRNAVKKIGGPISENEHVKQFLHTVVDKNIAIEDIQKRLGGVREAVNVHMAETQRPKTTAYMIEKFWDERVLPLITGAAKAKLKISDIEELAHARHAPEANEALRIARAKSQIDGILSNRNVDKKTKEQLREETSQAEEILGPDPAGYSLVWERFVERHSDKIPEPILDYWNKFKERASGMTDADAEKIVGKWKNNRAINVLVDQISAINDEKLDLLFRSGQISKKAYVAYKTKYENYAPLYREGFEGEAIGSIGRGLQAPGKPIQVRGGSLRGVVNILSNTIKNYETAVVRSEKARSVEKLYDMVSGTPDPDFWKINRVKKAPYYDNYGNIHEYPTRKLSSNEMAIKIKGQRFIIWVNSQDKTAMRMLETLKGESISPGPVVNFLSKVNRYLSAINTMYAPEFILSNFFRDMQTAGVNIKDTGLSSVQMLKKVKKSIGTIAKIEMKRGKVSAEETALYKRFREAGGKISWMDMHQTAESLAKKIESEFKYQAGKKPARSTIRKWNNLWQALNTSVENGARFAAFKIAVDAKMSDSKAAMIASDLTVDFTRKGARGQVLNSLYLFANAGVQGSYRMIRALKNKNVRRMAGGIVALGFLSGAWNDSQDDDDIEDYLKERNIVLKIPNSDKNVKIPLPWGFNTFFNLGDELAKATFSENYDALHGAARLVSVMGNAFNPLQAGTVLQTIAPTAIDPFAMVAENKNWFGGPMMPEKNKFEETPTPDSQRFFRSVSRPAKWVAQELNRLTGGDQIKKGAIDVSPETLELVMDQAGGSAVRFARDIFLMPGRIARDELDIHRIPFLRRVAAQDHEWASMQRYYKAREEVLVAKKQAEVYGGDYRNNGILRLYTSVQASEKQLRALRKQKDRAKDNERLDSIKKRMDAVYDKFVSRYQVAANRMDKGGIKEKNNWNARARKEGRFKDIVF